MEAGKVIENVIIYGGIGAMAYLLFKKKPVVEQKVTKKVFLGGIEIKNRDSDPQLRFDEETCAELDLEIKKSNGKLENLYLLVSRGSVEYNTSINITKQKIADLEAKFSKLNCRDKIEAIRIRSFADALTETAIKSEKSILGKGFKEQKTYIALGGLVLLLGLYVVTKK
jgi:hypothetical protein